MANNPPFLAHICSGDASARQSLDREVVIPSPPLDASHAHKIFRHPAAQSRGRSYFREAIRFFHWPFHDFQQELLETGDLYRTVSQVTAQTLTRTDEATLSRIVRRQLALWAAASPGSARTVNLVDQIRTPVVQSIYEFLFDTSLPAADLPIFCLGTQNFHDTMKGVALRSKQQRLRLLERVTEQVRRRFAERSDGEKAPPGATPELIAQHYAAVFFATGTMQCVEFIVHTLTALMQNESALARLMIEIDAIPDDADYRTLQAKQYLDQVSSESLRLYPLFGRTTRDISGPIDVGECRIGKGSTVLLDFVRVHSEGWQEGEKFLPERWDKSSPQCASRELRSRHYMPFGTGPRKCPAKAFSLCVAKTALTHILKNLTVLVPRKFVHTRRIPWGVPAVIERRQAGAPPSAASQALLAQLERTLPRTQDRGRLPGLAVANIFAEMMNNRRRYGLVSWAFLSPLLTGAEIGLFYLSRSWLSRPSGAGQTSPASNSP